MRTWFDYDTQKWVSERPERYYVNLRCIKTNEKIFVGDTISICEYRWTGRRFKEYRKTIVLRDKLPYLGTRFCPFFLVSYSDREQEMLKPILIGHNNPRKIEEIF